MRARMRACAQAHVRRREGLNVQERVRRRPHARPPWPPSFLRSSPTPRCCQTARRPRTAPWPGARGPYPRACSAWRARAHAHACAAMLTGRTPMCLQLHGLARAAAVGQQHAARSMQACSHYPPPAAAIADMSPPPPLPPNPHLQRHHVRVPCHQVHDGHLRLHVLHVLLAHQLRLGDGLDGVLLARLLVDGQLDDAEGALACSVGRVAGCMCLHARAWPSDTAGDPLPTHPAACRWCTHPPA